MLAWIYDRRCRVFLWTKLYIKSYLVPARLRHAVDILLVRVAATVHDTVTIAVTASETGAPLVRDIPVAL